MDNGLSLFWTLLWEMARSQMLTEPFGWNFVRVVIETESFAVQQWNNTIIHKMSFVNCHAAPISQNFGPYFFKKRKRVKEKK